MDKASKRLRVLRLVDTIVASGAPYNQFSLAWAEKHEITMCSIFEPTISVPRSITVFNGDGSIRGFFRALKAALDSGPYDIIHIHTPHTGAFFLLAGVVLFDKMQIGRTVYTIHNLFGHYKIKHVLMSILTMIFFRRIVCCSYSSFASIPWFYRWLAGKRLCAIVNGTDIERIDRSMGQLSERRQGGQPFTILVVGRLIKVKAPGVILKAFQRLDDQDSRLIFIGDGFLQEELTTQSRKMGISERVQMTGLIERDKVFHYLFGADVFVSTSLSEGLPVAVLEAMACKRPVILSDIPAHREIADGAEFIPIVPPGDVTGFVREIRRFREMSAAERKAIGEKCRKLVEERFSLTEMYNSYEKLYREVIDQA